MKPIITLLTLASVFLFSSCSTTKTIYEENTFYKTEAVNGGGGNTYTKYKIKPTHRFKAEITEKTDYIILNPEGSPNFTKTVISSGITDISPSELEYLGKYYFPGDNSGSLRYFDIKFGLQALTIPLKFRKSVGNDALNPPTIETGVNVGFAPGWKFTHNVYKQSKNYLGKNTSQYAIAIGPHFGLGTTDLKKTTNAPDILSDRKGAVFTYGGYILIGLNNINIGFALGRDKTINQGKIGWVYDNKTWTGIIISLDILKF